MSKGTISSVFIHANKSERIKKSDRFNGSIVNWRTQTYKVFNPHICWAPQLCLIFLLKINQQSNNLRERFVIIFSFIEGLKVKSTDMTIATLTCLKLWLFVQSRTVKRSKTIKHFLHHCLVKLNPFISLRARKTTTQISLRLINFKRIPHQKASFLLLRKEWCQWLISYLKV